MPSRKAKSTVDGPGLVETPILSVPELIARRAYELYESRGSGPGDELTDWLAAEQEVLAGTAASLEQEAPRGIDNPEIVAARGPRKKASKATPTVASRSKASSTVSRSSNKPKGAHP
jgi:hypothetical protein